MYSTNSLLIDFGILFFIFWTFCGFPIMNALASSVNSNAPGWVRGIFAPFYAVVGSLSGLLYGLRVIALIPLSIFLAAMFLL